MITHIGQSPWTRDEMRAGLEEFAALYERRPIQDNAGGMSSTHCFLFWSILRALRPKAVIESGVWKGQGTWFIEQACPDANLYCIDINWKNLEYRSTRATYISTDFAKNDWSSLPKEETVVFFDDHIDAMKRVRDMDAHGFKHVVFEDNYPPGKGDCYSLKEAFQGTGHRAYPGMRAAISRALGRLTDRTVPPNSHDAAELRDKLDVYEELPPIFKLEETRWGDPWDEHFPTPEPLLERVEEPWQQRYFDEAKWYTWICYGRLKG